MPTSQSKLRPEQQESGGSAGRRRLNTHGRQLSAWITLVESWEEERAFKTGGPAGAPEALQKNAPWS